MTEKQIGEKLLAWESAESDPQQTARAIVARDRRVSRLLAGGVILLWLIAVGLMFPLIAELRMAASEFSTTMRDVIAVTKIESDLPTRLSRLSEVGGSAAVASVFLLMLATVCTLLLIRSSRRATLRQVNANLMAISQQIADLKGASVE